MRRTFLSEAFRALDLLEEQNFDISQKDDFDEFKMFFEDMDDEEENVTVIDTDAETEVDIEDSYDGKIICDCPVCHSKIFKDIKDIILDDNEELANVGEECPYCYSVDGFKIIGEVAPFHKEYDATAEDKDGNPVDVELSVEDDDVKLEALKRRIRKAQRINESRNRKRSLREAVSAKVAYIDCSGSIDDDIIAKAEEDARNKYGINEFYYFTSYVSDNPDDVTEDGRTLLAPVVKHIKQSGLRPSEVIVYTDEDADPRFQRVDIEDFAKLVDIRTLGPLSFRTMDPEDIGGRIRNEALEKLDLETENDLIHVTAQTKDEQIVPVDMGLEDEIRDNQPLEDDELEGAVEEEEPSDEELPDEFDVDEFDEESFDELGESYLKQVYNNVRKFHTTRVMGDQSKIFVEGLITFKSGNSKKTLFRFDDYQVGKRNNLKLFGENLNLKTNKKAFTLTGKVRGGKFITEKLNYNYNVKDASGKKTRLTGKVTKK